MAKSIKKEREVKESTEQTSNKYYTRLDDDANTVINNYKKKMGSSKRFIINNVLKNLPPLNYEDYLKHVDKIKEKNNYKNPSVCLSNILMDNTNLERLRDELLKAEKFAIINNYPIPKEASLLNYIIVKYVK